jgi:hypothetical protein
MIFPKQYLAEALEKKYKNYFHHVHPYKTIYRDDEKNPYDIVIMNYYTFFDLKSNELKDLTMKSRKEIVDNCFNQDVMDTYPNTEKIEQCIKKINYKNYGKYFNAREVFYGNSKNIFKY